MVFDIFGLFWPPGKNSIQQSPVFGKEVLSLISVDFKFDALQHDSIHEYI